MSYNLRTAIRQFIPPLNRNVYKGQHGKVGIIGGCFEYTGAPYYAGISALKLGADLCHVICTREAAVPIKSYSPELIVHPILPLENDFTGIGTILNRLDALVIGPGLGRDPKVLKSAEIIINQAKGKQLPIILDGDALFLLSENIQLISGYQHAILTPNAMEYARLCCATGLCPSIDVSKAAELIPVLELSQKLGNVCIIQKGAIDQCSDGEQVIGNDEFGSPRRCGGQGDVLAGCIGTFASWIDRNGIGSPSYIYAALGGSLVTRKSAEMAFEIHSRSVTTPDVIHQIGKSFRELFE